MATAKKSRPGSMIKGLSAFVGLAIAVSAARADVLVSTVPQTNGSSTAGKQVPAAPTAHAAMGTLAGLRAHPTRSAGVPLFFPPVHPSPPPTPPSSPPPVISGSGSGPTGHDTPEPASLVGGLIGGGLLALFGWAQLRKKGHLLQTA